MNPETSEMDCAADEEQVSHLSIHPLPFPIFYFHFPKVSDEIYNGLYYCNSVKYASFQ